MQENLVVEVEIKDFDINGLGVAYLENRIIFVENALPSEIVKAKITNVHKKYAFATVKEIIKKSPERIKEICSKFQNCGGCDLMHINYEQECKIKENKVKKTLEKQSKLTEYKFNPIIKNQKITGYRNKIIVPFTKNLKKEVVYGFYAKKSHDLIPIQNCPISNQNAIEILNFISRYLTVHNVKIYDEETHNGLFKAVMIRNNYQDEMMLVLIVTDYYDFTQMVKYLTEKYPLIKSIYLNYNPQKTNVMLADKYELLYGSPTLKENILGLDFFVAPAAFLQVNHEACENLYKEAMRMGNLKTEDIVIDAYCGMGSITLNIDKKVKHVYGIEVVEEAIKNAKVNQIANYITNASFICGKCEIVIEELLNKHKVDVIFFDPPRKGCEESFLEAVIKAKIPKIIYISCNIASCSRDINYLIKGGYQLKEITPVDIFSRTMHVEIITLLELKKCL